MNFNPRDLQALNLDGSLLDLLIQEHEHHVLPRLNRFWDYYRNHLKFDPHAQATDRPYRLAQEQGLPARLTQSTATREVVVENDIAWRLHTLADFMFAKPFAMQSTASDPETATRLEAFLKQVLLVNGGIGFFQDLALLGSIYGHVDILVRPPASAISIDGSMDQLLQAASQITLEIVEAPRAIPLVNAQDYRRLDAYILHYRQSLNQAEQADGLWNRLRRGFGYRTSSVRATVQRTEIWTADRWAVFLDGELVEESVNPLGRIPVIHIQNLAQPFYYEGLSEVEPLIPLQDELNVRLSDRANRVTFQCFKMYLGKGIDGFTDRPVGPGQMWSTDNLDASIQEFGGDEKSPSEDTHIDQVRDAMDKTSGVNAVAAGVLRDQVGNLTSENALRIVLMGVLAKTEKRRVTYGAGIGQLAELILHASDISGIYHNRIQDRRIRIDWPNPLPVSTLQQLQEAKLKLELGVPRSQILTELGYGDLSPAASL